VTPFEDAKKRGLLEGLWYPDEGRSHPLVPFLYPLSLLYGMAVRIRNTLYERSLIKSQALPRPVVAIGNITVGGTGKTPLVMETVRLLMERGRRPAVLSRGYGGRRRAPVNIVSDGKRILMDPEEAGDEPVLLARRLPDVPVLVGPSRWRAGLEAIDRFGADCLVLDDAMQHRQLHRDVNIVLIDGQRGVGNGLLLPAGPLREPITSLKGADVVILTGSAEGSSPRSLRDLIGRSVLPSTPVLYARPTTVALLAGGSEETAAPETLRGEKICAFCGIASPGGFRRTVEALGGVVVSFLAFGDHHPYKEDDCRLIEAAARERGATMIVTTEKDIVKLYRFPAFIRNIHILRIRLDLGGDLAAFEAILGGKLGA